MEKERTMKHRFLHLTLLITLSLVLGTTKIPVQATGQEVKSLRQVPDNKLIDYNQVMVPNSAEPLSLFSETALTNLAPDVDLGETGVSFRYVKRLGNTEEAYIEDNIHLNKPYGLNADGTDIWVTELNGQRAQKFTNTGAFVQQIGKAGNRFGAEGTELESISDVGVDTFGNIWLVDSRAHHIAKFDSGGNFISELGVPWELGSDPDHFSNPRSVAFDSVGNIYVSDANNHRIQVFNSGSTYITTLGETGVSGLDDLHFNRPAHISVDTSDFLYVADAGNERVQIFDISEPLTITHVTTLGEPGVPGSDIDHFDYPLGVDTDGNNIYIADCSNNRVQIFDRVTYIYQSTIGTGVAGIENDQFRCPSDVSVDSTGNIYIADQSNMRVQQFDSGLNYVDTFGTTNIPYLTDGFHYNRPSGVAISPDNSIYLTEGAGHRLVKLSSSGSFLGSIGEPGKVGSDNGHFNSPQDLTIDSLGKVYVVDTSNYRIQIFSSEGAYTGTLGTGRGSGDFQFYDPHGIAVDSSGKIYVADTKNHRIQIYDSDHNYLTLLGETGVSGIDNDHFNQPRDVDVDTSGNIYVADYANHRVQVFDDSLTHVLTIGVPGTPGFDFDHFRFPTAVSVDADGRIYVADGTGIRVQVFDSLGAYLTTLGNSEGSRTGEMRQAEGLALDNEGNLYIAEMLNQRVQKFALGVPGWEQTNINGFGDRRNTLSTLVDFNGQIYAGTGHPGGAQIWRTNDGQNWNQLLSPWTMTNTITLGTISFDSFLYFGTLNKSTGGEMWRTSGTLWEKLAFEGFGDPNNFGINAFAVFSDTLYTATSNWETGVEIWRSPTGDAEDWSQANSDGFGNNHTLQDISMDVFQDQLYVGIGREHAELWRTDDGITWTSVFTDGLGSNNSNVSAMAEFNGEFYIGLINETTGGEVWRSNNGTDWTLLVTGGLGNSSNTRPDGLILLDGGLILVLSNQNTGAEVWRSFDGEIWGLVRPGGWGDSNNALADYSDKGATVFQDKLYIATMNEANGGEVWMFLNEYVDIFLPLIIR
jgi:streptogramin lyase